MSPDPPPRSHAAEPVHIRLGTGSDVPRLVDIEASAAQSFRGVGLHLVADDVLDPTSLRRAIGAERVWVADGDGEQAAYIIAEVVDGNAHIAQVSVAAEYAGRGIGHALVELVEAWGHRRLCPATTLTTFRDVPWNAPYYERIGYRRMDQADIGAELAGIIAHEALLPGLDQAPRCAMIKPNPASIVAPTDSDALMIDH